MRALLAQVCNAALLACLQCSLLACFQVSFFQGSLRAQGQLFEQLHTVGIQLPESTSVVLNPPLLMGRTPVEAKQLLDKLAQRHGWDRFSRNSPTAPVHVEVSYVQSAAGKRIGHNIYSAFIAYAPLTTLKDQELMAGLFGSSSEDKELMGFDPKSLTADILQKAGIAPTEQENARYSTLRIPLMNRVVIQGTARVEKLEKSDSIVIAWLIDPNFTMDAAKGESTELAELAEYANRYRKVVRDELGKELESTPVSYSGCGGYLSVTQTGLADNQLLIESRMAIYEPDEWFAGSNFLRSKFPAALQESAQSFRRKLSSKKPE